MKTAYIGVIIIALLTTISCAIAPTQHEIDTANYGPYPKTYRQIIENYMSAYLHDPFSAEYASWKGPSRGWLSNRIYGAKFGYRVCVAINAKNLYGGYVGWRPYQFVINNGNVIYHMGGNRPGTLGYDETMKLCSQPYMN